MGSIRVVGRAGGLVLLLGLLALGGCKRRNRAAGAGSAQVGAAAPASASSGVAPAATGSAAVSDCRTISPERCAKQCEDGDAVSCSVAANYFVYARGVPADPPRGMALAKRGCDLGYPDACITVGWLLETGKAGTRDPAGAARVYQKACDQGFPLACSNLGASYYMGEGVPKDLGRAADLWRTACDSGKPVAQEHACYNLAKMLLKKRDDESLREADDRLCQAAKSNSGLAYDELARLSLAPGRASDPERTHYLLRAACSRGIKGACTRLEHDGVSLAGTPPGSHQCDFSNLVEGDEECGKGARGLVPKARAHVPAGDADACCDLGHHYRSGDGGAGGVGARPTGLAAARPARLPPRRSQRL